MLQWLHFRVPTFPLKFEMGLSRLSPNFWLVYTSHLLSKWCLIVNSLIMINIICGKAYRWHNHDHSIKAGPIFLLWELNRVTRGARNPILNLLPPFMVKSQWLASKKRSPQVPPKKTFTVTDGYFRTSSCLSCCFGENDCTLLVN